MARMSQMPLVNQPDLVNNLAAKAQLALANRILFKQGVLDAFGHVSARDPINSDSYLLSRILAPARVRPRDIMTFDFDGTPLEQKEERVTVVKSAKLRPISHMGGFLSSTTPLFEIREYAGNGSDLLIKNRTLGAARANCLANHSVVLMRGHGISVVGDTLQQATFRAVYAEKNGAIQARAMALGEPQYLTDAEAASADEANQGQVQRAWEFWSLQAGAQF